MSLLLPHLWQHFVLDNIGSGYFSKGVLFWPICVCKVLVYYIILASTASLPDIQTSCIA